MERASRIPDEIRDRLPEILSLWRASRGEEPGDGPYSRLVDGVERLTVIFTEFLRTPETVETFSRGGAIRALVREIASSQHELGRDAVGVIEDFAVLRRSIWRSVEKRVDLSALDGGDIARFFGKLMDASDWVTEAGLEAYDAIVREEMDEALGRAAVTDLLTGLPDRDLFNRLLLPRAVASHDRFSIAVFDVARFSEAVRDLADAVREAAPEGSVCARFGDDEVCALLPGEGSEGAYRIAERVLERFARDPDDFEVDAGVAEYPAHGTSPEELITQTLKALRMAKRVGGSGIVVAR
jgi:GGDEF domain-containing protein